VDKHRVKAILAPYSPPLSPSQVDAIATAITGMFIEEKSESEALKSVKKLSKSRR